MSDKNQTKTPAPPRKFGTFGGVFTPSLLTIVGVIMFLRFSTVVGVAGCWHALLILLAATAITLVTGLSIASIATMSAAFRPARNAACARPGIRGCAP